MPNTQIETIAEIAQKISAENDRRQRLTHTINELIVRRQTALVLFCELGAFESNGSDVQEELEKLNKFGQALVDYTALGHFEIYERIMSGKERRESVKQVANKVYPLISDTTEQFVDFNDKYVGADDADSILNLHDDLSPIGEAMAARTEAEDTLLREMSDQVLKRTN